MRATENVPGYQRPIERCCGIAECGERAPGGSDWSPRGERSVTRCFAHGGEVACVAVVQAPALCAVGCHRRAACCPRASAMPSMAADMGNQLGDCLGGRPACVGGGVTDRHQPVRDETGEQSGVAACTGRAAFAPNEQCARSWLAVRPVRLVRNRAYGPPGEIPRSVGSTRPAVSPAGFSFDVFRFRSWPASDVDGNCLVVGYRRHFVSISQFRA